MEKVRSGNLRLLYLLALAQLVGGPIILLQVTLFCKLTLNETPRLGPAKAAAHAWHSDEFQTALEARPQHDSRSPLPSPDPKSKGETPKTPFITWHHQRLMIAARSVLCEIVHRERIWTPAWPQAPPGPPPRVG